MFSPFGVVQVDYTRSSTVWASDKWKGVFKVRWIFVRDIPNANLRHIKLKLVFFFPIIRRVFGFRTSSAGMFMFIADNSIPFAATRRRGSR